MTVIEIIGMQQVRIHSLEEQVGRLSAANARILNKIGEIDPDTYKELTGQVYVAAAPPVPDMAAVAVEPVGKTISSADVEGANDLQLAQE